MFWLIKKKKSNESPCTPLNCPQSSWYFLKDPVPTYTHSSAECTGFSSVSKNLERHFTFIFIFVSGWSCRKANLSVSAVDKRRLCWCGQSVSSFFKLVSLHVRLGWHGCCSHPSDEHSKVSLKQKLLHSVSGHTGTCFIILHIKRRKTAFLTLSKCFTLLKLNLRKENFLLYISKTALRSQTWRTFPQSSGFHELFEEGANLFLIYKHFQQISEV